MFPFTSARLVVFGILGIVQTTQALKISPSWPLKPFSVACYTGLTVTQADITAWDLLDWNDPANDAVTTHKLPDCDLMGDDTILATKHVYKRVVLQGTIGTTRFSFPGLKRQFRDELTLCPEKGQALRVNIYPNPGENSKLQPFNCEDSSAPPRLV